MYKILFRFVPLHLKTDRMGLSIRLTLIGIMSRRYEKCNDFRWQCLKKTTSPTSLAVFWWCLLRPKKDPRMGTSAGWTSSIPWRFCWQWSSRVFFRDLHHRNLDNEQRWFTVDFEFYVEIPCSLKHLFFQIQSFPELFAMRSYRDRSFWPWPVSHRSTSSALGQSAEKGQPSKSSANELKRRALWGRWVEVGCPLQMDLNIWRCMEHPQ